MRVRQDVTRGSSALFVVGSYVSAERLRDELAGPHVGLIGSDLSVDQQRRLVEVLGAAPPPHRRRGSTRAPR
jgi:uncharacterized membrane protein